MTDDANFDVELHRFASERVGEFDAGAVAYDRYRPRYPVEVFSTLMHRAGLQPGDRVLEVGCGTGIATVELVTLGLDVVAVEPAEQMAAIARSKLGDRATVVVDRFEDASVVGPFQTIVAFNAWHWITPQVGVERAATLVEPGGAIAVAWTNIVQWGQPPFEERLFSRLGTEWPKSLPLVSDAFNAVLADPRFEDLGSYHQSFTRRLNASDYAAVTRTYGSQHRPDLDEILADVIDGELDGSVEKVEDVVVRLARRR